MNTPDVANRVEGTEPFAAVQHTTNEAEQCSLSLRIPNCLCFHSSTRFFIHWHSAAGPCCCMKQLKTGVCLCV